MEVNDPLLENPDTLVIDGVKASPLEGGENKDLPHESCDQQNNLKTNETEIKLTHQNDFKEGDPDPLPQENLEEEQLSAEGGTAQSDPILNQNQANEDETPAKVDEEPGLSSEIIPEVEESPSPIETEADGKNESNVDREQQMEPEMGQVDQIEGLEVKLKEKEDSILVYCDTINSLETQIDQLNITITNQQSTLGDNEKELSQLNKLKLEKEEEITDLESQNLKLQAQCQFLEQDAITFTLEKEDTCHQFEIFKITAQSESQELTLQIQNLQEIITQQETDSQNYDQLKTDKEILEKRIEQLVEQEKEREILAENNLEKEKEFQNKISQLENQLETCKVQNGKQEQELGCLKKDLEGKELEKNELEAALANAQTTVTEFQEKSLAFNQEKKDVMLLLESLRQESEEEGAKLKNQINELQNAVQAAQINNESYNETIATAKAEALRLGEELKEAGAKMEELKGQNVNLETKLGDILNEKMEAEKSLDHLNEALNDREKDLQSKISKLEESIASNEAEIGNQKEEFKRDLESCISENEGLRRALTEAQEKMVIIDKESKLNEKNFLEAKKLKEEIAVAFLDFRKTTEFHKEQLQGRISELESSYRFTETNLVKQNEALKKENEDYKAKEDHMIRALAQAEIKLRQLQVPKATSTDKRSSSAKEKSFLKNLEAGNPKVERSKIRKEGGGKVMETVTKLESATKKLEAKKSELLKKSEAVKKLEAMKRANAPKRLDSAKKLEGLRVRDSPTTTTRSKGSTTFSDTLLDMEPHETVASVLKKIVSTARRT